MKARILALMGPTASGKSELALKLAPKLDAEIISLDSMMVYKGMDIGTAKPTAAERSRVRHHLIDILPPTEEYSVGRYVADVGAALQEISSAGKAALFVGGTALYWRALTRGLFLGPSARWEVRARLKEEALEKGTAALHERLEEKDAEAAARIHPNDLRRIVRALEVIELSGAAMSELQKRSPRLIDPDSAVVVAPDVPRKILYARIERRVDAMFRPAASSGRSSRHGLIEEVKGLLDAHGRLGRSASQALGYKEVLAHLASEMSLEEAEALVKKRTRHFARRQLTWLRSFPEVRWVQTSEPESEETASHVLEIFRATP